MKEESKYYYTDIETGQRISCTKEQLDNMRKSWEFVKPKFTKAPGSIIMFGTAGEVEDYDELKKAFIYGRRHK